MYLLAQQKQLSPLLVGANTLVLGDNIVPCCLQLVVTHVLLEVLQDGRLLRVLVLLSGALLQQFLPLYPE